LTRSLSDRHHRLRVMGKATTEPERLRDAVAQMLTLLD